LQAVSGEPRREDQLITLQRIYQASARFIQVAADLLDTRKPLNGTSQSPIDPLNPHFAMAA
jgi:hypothetical protein